jgi:DTW domain-containing protein YfiP
MDIADQAYRATCYRCLRSLKTCYCSELSPFDTRTQFVILQHPLEFRNKVGSARMTHHSLKGSQLWVGSSFGGHTEVNSLIKNRENQCFVLFPGPSSVNLSALDSNQMQETFPSHLKLVIFVLDGTWATARSMLRNSENLARLPQVSFSSSAKSEYQIRKQPREYCLSTLEAVHRLIQILEPNVDPHSLLLLFRSMVNRQIQFAESFRKPRYINDQLGGNSSFGCRK